MVGVSDRAYSVMVEWDQQPRPVAWVLMLKMARRRLAAMLPDGDWVVSAHEMSRYDISAFTNGSRGLFLYATPAKAEMKGRA